MSFASPFQAFVYFWFIGLSLNLCLYLVFVALSTIRWINVGE